MAETVIDNQAEFEQAFLKGKGNLRLAPGYYTVPVSDDANKVYTFSGTISGDIQNGKHAFLSGIFGVSDQLRVQHLVLLNNSSENVILFDSAVGIFDHVTFLRDKESTVPAVQGAAIVCYQNSHLIMSQSTISYRDGEGSFGGVVRMQKGVSAFISNSHLTSLSLAGGGSLMMDRVELSKWFVTGTWNITAADLTLYLNDDNQYIFPTAMAGKPERLQHRHWMVCLRNSTMVATNLHLPVGLPDHLSPLWMQDSQLTGSLADGQLLYQPWIETIDSQVKVDGLTVKKQKRPKNQQQASSANNHDSLKKLQNLIGLAQVKQQVNSFIQMALMNKRRKAQGMKPLTNSFHSLFEGNPGTGKTTVARLVGKIMYEERILPTDKYVEVDRGQLVAGYVGQTAKQTEKVLKSATGGVLFIDEAYDLVHDDRDTFGKEALDTIMKYMEDHREELMIIFAGYTEDMQTLLAHNPGMESRVPNKFTFEDYSPDEIAAIGRLQLHQQQLSFDSPSTEELYNQVVAELYMSSNDHSNGRWIRNRNDQLLRQLAATLSQDPDKKLDVITADDVKRTFGAAGRQNDGQDDSKQNPADHANPEHRPLDLPKIDGGTLPLLNGDELK